MLTMYSTPWCGYCRRLKAQLDREGIEYTVVDIEQDQCAASIVARSTALIVSAGGIAPAACVGRSGGG